MILHAASAWAGDIGTADINRDSVTVGDPITVTLRFSAPADYRFGPLTWPYPTDTLVPLEQPQARTAGDSVWEARTRVAMFATGRLSAVPDAVLMFGPGGDSLYVLFPPESVTVASVLPPGEDSLRPAAAGYKDIIEPPWRPPWWLWVALVAVAAAVAAYIWRRRRPEQVLVVPPEPERAPWEVALSQLEWLAAQGYHERGQARLFAIGLSEIMRRYLEYRYGFVALEQTTREISLSLRHAQITDAQRDSVLSTLEHCDLAKYAKFEWPTPELSSSLKSARRFVEETIPAPAGEARAA